jgi:hypothetical protein
MDLVAPQFQKMCKATKHCYLRGQFHALDLMAVIGSERGVKTFMEEKPWKRGLRTRHTCGTKAF